MGDINAREGGHSLLSPLTSSLGLGVFWPKLPSAHFSHLKLNSTSLNSTPLNSTQLNSTHFLTIRGAHFGASWPPKSTQDRLKSPLDTSLCPKPGFSRNIGRRNVWSISRAPRQPPKRPKIASRRLQDDLQEHLFSTSFLTSILVPLGSHFGLILAPL